MRVLLTNNTLDLRAGTELYVRDIALALLARGHEPIAYSRRLGEVGRELRQATVTVLDDLEGLERPPDLIHGQHHHEAMTALARFPQTPAIYICHGWLPDVEAPPKHPRILRYVAVDALVEQRLIDECGIPASQVETHLNFVDLERFPQRSPLPKKPRRALVFSNLVSEENVLSALRQACSDAGLELDIMGRSLGCPSATPETLLGDYDIVFAKGRAALEAAAVGAAVILCDRSGLGGMVTSATLEKVRLFNFGVRLLRREVTVQAVVEELGKYDAEDTAEVTRHLRQEAGLDLAIEKLLGLYESVLAEAEEAAPVEREESVALSRYLRWGPLTGGDFFQSERQQWKAEADHARAWAFDLKKQLDRAFEERKNLEARLLAAEDERQRLTAEAKARDASLQHSAQRMDQLGEALRQQSEQSSQRLQETEIAEQRILDLENELSWIRASRSWRLREKVLARRWLATVYRFFFGRKI